MTPLRLLARNFAKPSGVVGGLAGRMMVRGNSALNEAVARQLAEQHPNARRIAEVGCGPGVGLENVLACFPAAEVVGIDLSPRMIAQSGARNRTALSSGRLRVHVGGAGELTGEYDLVVAVHVLYFWPDPAQVLSVLRSTMTRGGVVALAYRWRDEMPGLSQREFPAEGYRLYDNDTDVAAVLTSAGFRDAQSTELARPGRLLGHLTTAHA